jgi:hypothetical protein
MDSMWDRSPVRYATIALLWLWFSPAILAAATGPHYLFTNDDNSLQFNSVTFYTVGTNGGLSSKQQVFTDGFGIAGGFFSTQRAVALNGSQQCVYASDAVTGDIVGIDVSTLVVESSASGSSTDSGAANGIGLAVNDHYLYAAFTTSNTIATFAVLSDCSLQFINDIPVAGLQGGFIDGMVLHGNLMVVTYGDGSIESFNIASGTPASNGDEQNSTGYLKSQGVSYPNSIEITQDGHYALFGDTSTSTVVEVSDIRSGQLSKTSVYLLGPAINSSNILLSPDESLLYISNTEGDSVTAASFDSSTGELTFGCVSGKLKGYGLQWSYTGELAAGGNSGSGGVVYVSEFGTTSYIGMVGVSFNGTACVLTELPNSPVTDANSPGLLSIGTFPPRSF